MVAATPVSAQETIRLRIASGHPPVNTYVNLMQTFFVPEVTKRVAERTKHKIEFVEGYGGAMVKVADTLEGVQSGIIDIGGYCFCFEPSNLPLHAFQVMLPFGTMDPVTSLKVARAVYEKVPYMSQVFEEKFKQKLIALIADNGYNLGTTMEWNNVSDLKGVKLAGAGLNLKWLEFAGAVPVQSSLVDAYTGLQTGIYNGWIMFPSGYVNFKLYEPSKYYTEIGFGAITWHGLTINSARWGKLPKDVQDIILEVAEEYEAKTGTVNKENYPKQIDELKAKGAIVRIAAAQGRARLGAVACRVARADGKGPRRQGPAGDASARGRALGGRAERPQMAGPLYREVADGLRAAGNVGRPALLRCSISDDANPRRSQRPGHARAACGCGGDHFLSRISRLRRHLRARALQLAGQGHAGDRLDVDRDHLLPARGLCGAERQHDLHQCFLGYVRRSRRRVRAAAVGGAGNSFLRPHRLGQLRTGAAFMDER